MIELSVSLCKLMYMQRNHLANNHGKFSSLESLRIIYERNYTENTLVNEHLSL